MGRGPTGPGRRTLVAALLATLASLVLGSGAARAASAAPTRDVLVASNNWEGTADFVDPHSFKRMMRLNIVPDRAQRIAAIDANPAALGYYLLVRQEIGEGHDQLVD